jgi:hypothetical protein
MLECVQGSGARGGGMERQHLGICEEGAAGNAGRCSTVRHQEGLVGILQLAALGGLRGSDTTTIHQVLCRA